LVLAKQRTHHSFQSTTKYLMYRIQPLRSRPIRRNHGSSSSTRIILPISHRSRFTTSVPSLLPSSTQFSRPTAIFSFYVTPTNSSTSGSGELTLGGSDTSKYDNSKLVRAALDREAGGFWEIRPRGVYVHGANSSATGGEGGRKIETVQRREFRMIFDSGTSNLVLPVDMTEVRLSPSFPSVPSVRNYSLTHPTGNIRIHLTPHQALLISTRRIYRSLQSNNIHHTALPPIFNRAALDEREGD
jgi:hypothetical protein